MDKLGKLNLNGNKIEESEDPPNIDYPFIIEDNGYYYVFGSHTVVARVTYLINWVSYQCQEIMRILSYAKQTNSGLSVCLKKKIIVIIGIQSKKKGLFGNKDENGEGGIEKKELNISNKKFDFPSIGNLAEEAIHTTELIIALFYFRHFESFRILY